MSSSTDQTQPLVGSVLEGKYRLQRELGAGGMGVVYLAQHETIERKVAIKVLHQKLASDDSVRRRFETEAKAIARLSHPHCVMLYEFGFSEEIEALFAVFEYVEGKSLESWVGQRLPLNDVVKFGTQVAEGIAHAHENNIIHRDLKPENIMIVPDKKGENFEAKLLDFGIARIAEDDEKRTRLTQMGQMFGTPPYMSPEQVRAKLNVTYATDIYSIGVILYEMIEGELPFLGETPIETVMMHLNEEVPPMSRQGIPDSLCAVVMRCLEKEAEDRFQSAEELAQALEEIELSGERSSVLAAPYTSKLAEYGDREGLKADEAPVAKADFGEDKESSDEISSGPTLLADEEVGEAAGEEQRKVSPGNEGSEPGAQGEAPAQDGKDSELESQEVTTQELADEGSIGELLPADRSMWGGAALLVVILGVGGVLGAAIFLGGEEEASDEAGFTGSEGEVAEAEGLDEPQDISGDSEEPEEELAAVDDGYESDEEEDSSEEGGAEEDGDSEELEESEESEEREVAEEDSPSEAESAQPAPAPRQQEPAPAEPEETASQEEPPQQQEAQQPEPTAPDAITLPGGDDDGAEEEQEEAPQAPEGIGLPAPD